MAINMGKGCIEAIYMALWGGRGWDDICSVILIFKYICIHVDVCVFYFEIGFTLDNYTMHLNYHFYEVQVLHTCIMRYGEQGYIHAQFTHTHIVEEQQLTIQDILPLRILYLEVIVLIQSNSSIRMDQRGEPVPI